MKHQFWLASLALTAVFIQSPTTVYACPEGMHHLEKMTQKLDLTPDQQNKIKAIRSNTKTALKAKFKAMHEVRMQINQLLLATPIDEPKIDALINQQKDYIGDIMKTRVNTRIAISNILTAPQRAKFNEMFKKWEEKRKARWEERKKKMQDKE